MFLENYLHLHTPLCWNHFFVQVGVECDVLHITVGTYGHKTFPQAVSFVVDALQHLKAEKDWRIKATELFFILLKRRSLIDMADHGYRSKFARAHCEKYPLTVCWSNQPCGITYQNVFFGRKGLSRLHGNFCCLLKKWGIGNANLFNKPPLQLLDAVQFVLRSGSYCQMVGFRENPAIKIGRDFPVKPDFHHIAEPFNGGGIMEPLLHGNHLEPVRWKTKFFGSFRVRPVRSNNVLRFKRRDLVIQCGDKVAVFPSA